MAPTPTCAQTLSSGSGQQQASESSSVRSGRHSGRPSGREAVVLALGKLVLPWLGLGWRLGSQHLCPGTAGCRGDGRAVSFRADQGLARFWITGADASKTFKCGRAPFPNLAPKKTLAGLLLACSVHMHPQALTRGARTWGWLVFT